MSAVQNVNAIDNLPDNDNNGIQENNETILLKDVDGKLKSQFTLLIEIGLKTLLFHDDTGDGFAEVIKEQIRITMPIRSKDFREHLSFELFNLIKKGASTTAITDAIATLEARAKFNGDKLIIAIRVHKLADSGDIFIDSGCSQRLVIHVSKSGWKNKKNAPAKFIKKRGTTALPKPDDQGNLGLLKRFINIGEDDFPLIYGWLLCALAGVNHTQF